MVAIIAVIIAVITGLANLNHREKKRLREQALASITAAIKTHSPALVRRRAQLVTTDAYGKVKYEKWFKELEYFYNEHIIILLSPYQRELLAKDQFDIKAATFLYVEQETNQNPAFQTFTDDMKPNEFETFCAEQLKRAGWDARVTMQSRDQGVDVVAEKNGVRVVVQCKLYSRPVGNKAVQEIAAARAHEKADYGIVASNNRYTQDAQQLASTNSVLLLHYTDLPNLDRLIWTTVNVSDHWYYNDGVEQGGPVSLEELRGMLASLPKADDLFVWCNTLTAWERASLVPELQIPAHAS